MLYGTVQGLLAVIPAALSLLIASDYPLNKYYLALQAAAFGSGNGFFAAALLGLFVGHDPRQADLQLFKRRPLLSAAAAFASLLSVLLYHIAGYQMQGYFPPLDWDGLAALIKARPGLVLFDLVSCLLIGASLAPPRFMVMLALQLFTFWDVLRGRHPHHNEANAAGMPEQEHGQLHAREAVWWAYRAQAPRARYEWSEARRMGGMHQDDYREYASFLAAVSDLSEAEQIIREGIKRFPESVKLRYGLTDLLEMQNLQGEAEDEYRRILSLDPNHAPSLHAFGNILYEQGRLDEALVYFNRALDAADNSSKEVIRYLNSRGAILATLSRFEEAEADFKGAIQRGAQFRLRDGTVPAGVRDASQNLGMLHGMRRRHGAPYDPSDDADDERT